MKIHKKFFQILTDLLFPRRCPVCDRPVQPFGRDICASCKDALIPYYAKFGFVNEGVSESVHGNVVWYQMRLRF